MARDDDSALARSLEALSTYFVGDATLGDTLDRVARLARDAIANTAYVGMTMMVDDHPGTGVFTDPDVPEIDEAQYDADWGPCLESFRTGQILRIESMRADTHWPEFAEACLQHGILSSVSMPMTRGTATLGAMNFYSRVEHAYGDEEVAGAATFAQQASVLLANAAAYWDARKLGEQLRESIESRAVIEQAKGIIMGAMRCDADQAFTYLVQQSQHMNVKLRDVARGIVEDVARTSRS